MFFVIFLFHKENLIKKNCNFYSCTRCRILNDVFTVLCKKIYLHFVIPRCTTIVCYYVICHRYCKRALYLSISLELIFMHPPSVRRIAREIYEPTRRHRNERFDRVSRDFYCRPNAREKNFVLCRRYFFGEN